MRPHHTGSQGGVSGISEGEGSLPILLPLPFHICSLTYRALSWERTGCLSTGALREGSSSPRRPGCGAGWRPGPWASLPPAPCCSGAGLPHPLGTNKQETDTNLVPAPSAWPPPSSPHLRCCRTCPTSPQPLSLNHLQYMNKFKLTGMDSCKKKSSRILHLATRRFYTLNW